MAKTTPSRYGSAGSTRSAASTTPSIYAAAGKATPTARYRWKRRTGTTPTKTGSARWKYVVGAVCESVNGLGTAILRAAFQAEALSLRERVREARVRAGLINL